MTFRLFHNRQQVLYLVYSHTDTLTLCLEVSAAKRTFLEMLWTLWTLLHSRCMLKRSLAKDERRGAQWGRAGRAQCFLEICRCCKRAGPWLHKVTMWVMANNRESHFLYKSLLMPCGLWKEGKLRWKSDACEFFTAVNACEGGWCSLSALLFCFTQHAEQKPRNTAKLLCPYQQDFI